MHHMAVCSAHFRIKPAMVASVVELVEVPRSIPITKISPALDRGRI